MNSRLHLMLALACATCTAAVAEPAEPHKLDLPTAIQVALARNRDLARDAGALRGQELGVSRAEADFAVRLRPDGEVGASADNNTLSYGLAAVKKLPPGTELQAGGAYSRSGSGDLDTHRTAIKVELRQPLFRSFGALIHQDAIAKANSALQAARRSFEKQKAGLVIQLVDTYETILRLEQQIRSDESFCTRMDKLLRLTSARERQGATTRVDTLRVDLQRGQARSRLESNRELLFSAQRDLAELLGAPTESSFELEPPPLLDFELPPLEEAVRIALSNRLDYAQTLQDLDDRQRAVRVARRGLYPDIALVARHQWFGEGPQASESTDLGDNDWFLGLAAGTDFNPAQEHASLGQARVNARSSLQTIGVTEQSIAREVQQRMSDYRRAKTDISLAERNHEVAEGRAHLARRLFELGKGDNFTVTDAEQAALDAQTRLLAARAGLSLAGYRLMQTLGTLIEHPDELKPRPPEVRL